MSLTSTLLQQLLLALIVAVPTAVFTTWLALRRFRTERLWEHKLDAYKTTLESIHNLRISNRIALNAEEGRLYSVDYTKAVHERGAKAWQELAKQTAPVHYFLSQEAANLLSEFEESAELDSDNGNYYEELDTHSVLLKDLQFRLREAARRDLSSKGSWLPRVRWPSRSNRAPRSF